MSSKSIMAHTLFHIADFFIDSIHFFPQAYECDNEEETCLRQKEQMYWSSMYHLLGIIWTILKELCHIFLNGYNFLNYFQTEGKVKITAF